MTTSNPSLFIDPADGWSDVQTGAGHVYGIDSNGVHEPYIELETNGSGALYTVTSGRLSANPHGYEGIPETQDLLNREQSSGSQRFSDDEQIQAMKNDALVGQPLPEAVHLYLHPIRPVPMNEQQWSPIAVLTSPTAVAFGYVDIDPVTIAPALGNHLNDAEFIADNPTLEDELNDSTTEQKVTLLLAGLIDIPVPGGTAIGQTAETAPGSGTRRGGFTVFVESGPMDPVRFYDGLGSRATVPNDDAANAMTKLTELAGQSTWPLFDTSDRSTAISETTQKTFPMPVLKALREQHDLSPSEWRTVGDNQKSLYLDRLAERVGHGDGSVPAFEFEMLDLKNVFQLEAISEFFVNYPEPFAEDRTPRRPEDNLSGANATIDDAYDPDHDYIENAFERIELAAGQSLDIDTDDIIPNLDHLILWGDTERPSRTYRIVEADSVNQTVIVEGNPSLDGGTSAWEIQGYKTVDLLDPAGTQARLEEVTPPNGESGPLVKLDDADSDVLRWVWLRSEGRDKDQTDQPDTMTDTIVLGDDELYEITGVIPEEKAITVKGTPDFSEHSSWKINRRPSVVVVDPLGHRIAGRTASMSAGSSSSEIELAGPTPDLSRVNPNFDTVYFHDGTGDRTYRIADVDDDAGTVTLHEQPSLPSEGSQWGINSGVGGVMPPLYYVLGNATRGYNHYDGMLFVVGGGAVRRSFRWTSYTSRNYPDGHQSKSSSRGNMRYQYESWGSGSDFQNLNIVVADCLSKYHPYSVHWQILHADGNREAAWYFDESPPADPLAVNPSGTVPADRTPADQPGPSEDGKTHVRFHWSPHYRSWRGARSAGCITSPSYPGLRRALAEYYQEENQALTGDRDDDIQAIIENLANQEAAEDNHRTYSDEWRYTLVGDVWLIRPGQRPTEEG